MRARAFLVVTVLALAGAGAAQPASSMTSGLRRAPADRARATVRAAFGKLPLYFVENRGVFPDAVRYTVRGADKTLYFTDHGVTFALGGKTRRWTVKLDFEGADPTVRPVGCDRQRAVISYFLGAEKDWAAGLRTFASIVYRELWPGVDLAYRGNVSRLKYAFTVAPGADPARIRLRYRGASSLTVTATGALRIVTPQGAFEDAPPEAWQVVDGRRVAVDMAYAMGEDGRFGFKLGDYDRAHPLILDPVVLIYCGYLGGNDLDVPGAVSVDGQGNACVVGMTLSAQPSFPVKVGPDLTYAGGVGLSDGFVAKVNAAGTALVYCGYIGGIQDDQVDGVVADTAGSAYVVGSTRSDEKSFPVKVGPSLTHNGVSDVFVAKVNPTGTGLDYCGYIGGRFNDHASGIASDATGAAYVTGSTMSTQQSFPVKVGPRLTAIGADDVFVAKVNPTGAGLVYCGYIGGHDDDFAGPICVDARGAAYLVGTTRSSEQGFTLKDGPDLTYNGGTFDVFVAKVSPSGSALEYCGYIGGDDSDMADDIAVDATGAAIVVGSTASTEKTFPVKVGPELTFGAGSPSGREGFVAKLAPSGKHLVYCGYLGGQGHCSIRGVVIDATGAACVAGSTASTESTFPVKVGPDLTHNGGYDAFVARIHPGGVGLTYCGYLGGAGNDSAADIALDCSGGVYLIGRTDSDQKSFPVRVGPGSSLKDTRWGDVFVAKLLTTRIIASGAPRPGGTISLQLETTAEAGLPYVAGSSLGPGPLALGRRRLGLSHDDLLVISVSDVWPAIFAGYRGLIDPNDRAVAAIHIPNDPRLVGTRVYSAFVTLDPAALDGIRSIAEPCMFTINP